MPSPTITPPFRLAAGPLAFRSKFVPATGHVTVYNQGTAKTGLDVTASTLHLGGTCGQLSMVPAKFHLAVSQHRTVMVTDRIPNADLGAKFSAVIHGQHGLGTAGGIAARFLTGSPVGSAACATTPKAVPLHTVSAGFPWWIVILAAVVLAVVAGIVVLVRKRRARRNDTRNF